MVKITKEAALEYHEAGRPGKIFTRRGFPMLGDSAKS